MVLKIDVKTKVQDLDAETKKALEAATREIADHAFVTLMANTPVRTGKMRSSYQKFVSGLTARITSLVSYIWAVERGTRPHIIAPKNARALHFVMGNRDVFAKSVMHPGFPGRFFIRRTRDTVSKDAPRIVARHLDKVGKR